MTATASQTSLDEAAATLRSTLAVFTEPGALAALGDQDLLTLLRETERLGRSIDGVRVLAAGEIADRSRPDLGPGHLSTRLGCRTPAEVIERTALVSGRTARARVRLAERIRPAVTLTGELLPGAFPRVRAALADGTLSTDAAAAIVGELGPVLDRGSVIDAIEGVDGVHAAEHELVAAAQAGEPCDDVRMMAQTRALFLDPDGALPDEERAQRKRGIHLGRQRDGVVPFNGALLPEVAAQLQLLLDAYTNPKAGEGPRFVPDP
ncbi:DUF222 domain-containing protein [Microbacterium sp. 18062]|uniref:DUF222 domain-containing protein n=1 Tax=Microbacterium sp. 18062 TaxID=2681410 RepID=UPI00135A05C8|nr:DUF222 domain-containing protein [Microbacterium sp. 18062]